jgi:CDP-diglyceride synthetase
MHGISLRLGVIWFFGTILVCTLGWLAMLYWYSTVRTPFVEGLTLPPWWHGWDSALFTGAMLGLITGVFATFHPLRKSVLKKGD